MIDKETLKKFAKLNNMKPWQQEKHYIQALILTALSEYPLIFKGGTYLFFFHGLNRFSEDLDFTATEKIPENIENKTLETLSFFGVEATAKTIKSDGRGFSFRISTKGPLYTSSIDTCYVYVEISTREKILDPILALTLNFDAYQTPTKIINGMSLDEVAAEKIRAIMTRNKARDVYDLSFLISKNIRLDVETVNKKLDYYNKLFEENAFIESVESKKTIWSKELKPLVFGAASSFEETEKSIKKWLASELH
jgi:predicted nucleotidyltransferase component of viral defense system